MAQGNGLSQIHAHRTLGVLAQTAQADGLRLRSGVPCLIGISGWGHGHKVAERMPRSARNVGAGRLIVKPMSRLLADRVGFTWD